MTAESENFRLPPSVSVDAETVKRDDDQRLLIVVHHFGERMREYLVANAVVLVALGVTTYLQTGSRWVLAWGAMVLLLQGPRYWLAKRAASSLDADTDNDGGRRVREAMILAGIGGLSTGSIMLLAPLMVTETKAIVTMLLMGLVAVTVATCHGFRPIYQSFVLPTLTWISIGWLIPGQQSPPWIVSALVVILTMLFGSVMFRLTQQVYQNFASQYDAARQLESALQAEQEANAAKTRFIAAASHDLRQPLHALSMLSSALVLRDLDDQTNSIAESMNESVQSLSFELDALLDISKLDAGGVAVDHTVFDLVPMLGKLVDDYQNIINRDKQSLHLEAPASFAVNTDTTLLSRILRNLLDNAVKYGRRGRISVTLRRIGAAENGAHGAELVIADQGPGIAKAEQARIWQEFYQVPGKHGERGKGLGLGLSIVARLSQLLEIPVELSSPAGDGARFTLTLTEVQATPLRSPMVAATTIEPAQLDGRVVLIIDDDSAVRLGTSYALSALGVRVLEAATVDAARHILASVPVDLVLIDLRLQEAPRGFDYSTELATQSPGLKRIIISGETDAAQMEALKRTGETVLVKPINFDTLVGELTRLLPAESAVSW